MEQIVSGRHIARKARNTHFAAMEMLWKLVVALWPFGVLIGIATAFVVPNLKLRSYRNFRQGRGGGGNKSYSLGDPVADAQERATKAGLDIDIRHPDD